MFLQLLLAPCVAGTALLVLLALLLLPVVAWVTELHMLLLLWVVLCGEGLRVLRLTLSRCGAYMIQSSVSVTLLMVLDTIEF